jgi:hypothetical protein
MLYLNFQQLTVFFDRYFFEHEIDKSKLPKTPGEIQKFLLNPKNKNTELLNRIYKWLDNFNPYEFTLEVFNSIEEFIKNNKKIKFIILIWRNEDIRFALEKNKWIFDYTPYFSILNDSKNIFVESFLVENNLRVCDEFTHINKINFENGVTDVHPSLNGHRKIFEIIKNYIDEKNSTNSW